jgi:hypothetical protein
LLRNACSRDQNTQHRTSEDDGLQMHQWLQHMLLEQHTVCTVLGLSSSTVISYQVIRTQELGDEDELFQSCALSKTIFLKVRIFSWLTIKDSVQ